MITKDETTRLDQIADQILAALDRRCRNRTGDEPRPIRALTLARAFGISPTATRETRRREVRKVIRFMRERQDPVVSTLKGYYLAEDAGDHAAYQTWRRSRGLVELAAASADKRSDATLDVEGQMMLFPEPTRRRRY